jgi:hypothetical protein
MKSTAQNLARQYTYRNEFNYVHIHAFSNPDMDILKHVEHCLEMLRVRVMCDADPTMYPASATGRDTESDKAGGEGTGAAEHRWTIDPRPRRVCRDFGKMAKWADEHTTVPFSMERDA